MEAAEIAIAERLPAARLHASLYELEKLGETVIDLTRAARCQPHRLHPYTRTDWVEGYDLIQGRRLRVPWALIGLDHRFEPDGFHDAFEVSSDGLASGNSTAEAALHGICELIERDAYALFELLPEHQMWNRLCAVGFIDDPHVNKLLSSFERARVSPLLFEITTDIRVPSYMAVLSPSQPEMSDVPTWSSICGGCGCHPLPARAIARALTEAARARAALVAGARDDLSGGYYGPAGRILQLTPDVLASTERRMRPPAESEKELPCATIGARISQILRKLIAAGIDEVVVVKLPTEDLGISIVRVLIPDLQIPLHGQRTQVSRRALRQLLELAA